jgi:hypothetical protein
MVRTGTRCISCGNKPGGGGGVSGVRPWLRGDGSRSLQTEMCLCFLCYWFSILDFKQVWRTIVYISLI